MSVVLATAGFDHKIRFWEAPSGVCSRVIRHPDSQVNRLEITPDKQFIAAAGNPVIRLYEVDHTSQNQQAAVLTLEGHTANITSIGFQKDGRYLYSGSEDGTIKVWDLRNPNYSRSFDTGSSVNSVALRSDSDEIVSGNQQGYVQIWDLGGNGCINSVRPSAAGARYTAELDKYNSQRNSNARSSGSSNSGTNSNNNPGGNNNSYKSRVVLHSRANNNIYSETTRQREQQNRQHHVYTSTEGSLPIQAVDVSEDSTILTAVSNHGTVFVWDPSGSSSDDDSSNSHGNANPEDDDDDDLSGSQSLLRPVTKYLMHSEPGYYCLQARIAPNGRHLVTTSSDGTARLWDTSTWKISQTLSTTSSSNEKASSWIWDAAFCADSSYLVTASSDNIARLWNLRTGTVVRQYHGHQSAVTCVALNDCSV